LLTQPPRRCQPGDAGPHNDHIRLPGRRYRFCKAGATGQHHTGTGALQQTPALPIDALLLHLCVEFIQWHPRLLRDASDCGGALQ
jgi:hypothetical protein